MPNAKDPLALAADLSRLFPSAAVFAVDRERRIRFWSTGAERLLGFAASEVIDQTCLAGNRCIECLSGCGISREPCIDGARLRLLTAAGVEQPVRKHAIGFRDAEGQFDGGIEVLFAEVAPIAEILPTRRITEAAVFHGMAGSSPAMLAAFDLIRRVAVTEMPVLIRGESGTGKELAARAIHAESPRHDGPFVALNCATLTSSLLESELFGHVRGAFTGAMRDHRGVFERAKGGTLFLDEVAELPLDLQAKLLRVLETGEFTPIGGEKTLMADARIVTATHRALREEARGGRFREDLLYRLRVVPVFLPALRERPIDIPLLVRHLCDRPIDTDALRALVAYDWPGNVRELRNALQYGKVMAGDGPITLRHLPPEVAAAAPPLASGTSGGQPEARTVAWPTARRRKRLSAAAIEATIGAVDGDLAEAARRLGVSRTTLWRWRRGG